MEARGREVIGGEDLHDRNDQRRVTAVVTEAEIRILISDHARVLAVMRSSKARVLAQVSRLNDLAHLLPYDAFQCDPSILREDGAAT
jgi:hypothetical protein